MHHDKRMTIFILCMLGFIAMLYVSLILIRGDSNYPQYDPDFINKFTLEIDGKTEPVKDRRAWSSIQIKKNSKITLSTIMPKDSPELSRINIKVLYSSLELSLNGETIYSYGIDRQKTGKPLASGYHKIRLPKHYQGKRLDIKVVPSGNFKLSYLIQHISFGANQNINIFILRQNLFAFMVSVFLMMFGMIIFIIYMVLSFRWKGDTLGLAYLSVFTFCVGLWGLCSIDFIQIFSDNIILNHYVEYFAFYLIFPSWIFVISYLKKSSVFYKWLNLLKIVFGIFLCTVIVFQTFGIMNYDKFLPVYHILALISSLFCLIVLAYKYKSQPSNEKLLFLGSIAAIFGTIAQGILYNAAKYFNLSSGYIHVAWLYTILLLIVCTFIISYGMKFSKSIISKRELQLLQKMAYEDCLTELGNRQSGIIQLLDYEKCQQHYYLVVFDLNNLKTANDVFGHATGDQMLINFANCLNLAFPNEATKLRIGGDEFLVIVPTNDLSIINHSINNLRTEMQNIQTAPNESVALEVAYGIASTAELSSFDYKLILSAADKRMYINKKMVKDQKEEQLKTE